METRRRDLSELPRDILMEIISLLEIPDLQRAASVCSSWLAAYTSLHNLGQFKRPQTPCLLYTSESENLGDNIACLYSLAEKRTYRLRIPDPPISRRFLLGCSHGWLVTADERSEMHIVNPITGEQIALPSAITFEQVTPIFDGEGTVCEYVYSRHTANRVIDKAMRLSLEELRRYFHRKAFVFYDDPAGSYVVVLIHNPWEQLSFARVGHDQKWTWLPPHLMFQDCIYKDGMLYAVTWSGEIFAFDLNAAVITAKIVMPKTKHYLLQRVYIVQAPWGDLLQVWRPTPWDDDLTQRPALVRSIGRTKIFRVDTLAKKLVEISSLDDHVLFIGNNQTLCLGSNEYPQLKANHIYFTDDFESLSSKRWRGYCHDIGIVNIRDKSSEEIVSPRVWLERRAPVFLVPNPRKMNSTLHN